jgi:hypothetical protein
LETQLVALRLRFAIASFSPAIPCLLIGTPYGIEGDPDQRIAFFVLSTFRMAELALPLRC